MSGPRTWVLYGCVFLPVEGAAIYKEVVYSMHMQHEGLRLLALLLDFLTVPFVIAFSFYVADNRQDTGERMAG